MFVAVFSVLDSLSRGPFSSDNDNDDDGRGIMGEKMNGKAMTMSRKKRVERN